MTFLPRRSFLSLAALSIALSALHARQPVANSPSLEDERAALMRTDKEFSKRSAEKGMSAAFLEYLGENAVMLPSGGTIIEGTEKIRKLLGEPTSGSVLVWKPFHAEVAASRDLGYTYGTYESHFVDEAGKPAVRYGKYVSVWRKQQGKWKWVVDVGNASPPPDKQ
jgi:ketosteroid isomerase-like protein